ncbi:UbiA prenyltransferase family-domain-containing protein [Xylariaceae sp. FL0016]|nr:UbiA prenyltransferase family-domain-containing protein [Xylariaceae sp. FL0016]
MTMSQATYHEASLRPEREVRSLLDRAYTTFRSLSHPLHILYLFSCSDFNVILMTLCFGAITSSTAQQFDMGPNLDIKEILKSFSKMKIWFWSNLFLFKLQKQRKSPSIAEDRINKPWRPPASGKITQTQADVMMYAMYPVVAIVALMLGSVGSCILQTIFAFWHEWNGARNGFLKSLQAASGLACLCAGSLEIVTRCSVLAGEGKAATWLLLIAAAVTTTLHAQDFRDVEGDRATGRNTIPILLGDARARHLLTFGLVFWTGVACSFWHASYMESTLVSVAVIAIVTNLYGNRNKEGERFGLQATHCLDDRTFWAALSDIKVVNSLQVRATVSVV